MTGLWGIIAGTAYPSQTYVNQFSSWLADRLEVDCLVAFSFPDKFSAEEVSIHHSRLIWAGGPLASLVTGNFKEHIEKKVQLSEEDDPTTFGVVRNFLYGKTIILRNLSVSQLLNIVRSAHRWQLNALFCVVCTYVKTTDRLADASKVVKAVDIVSLPGVPRDFIKYFFLSSAKHFSGFSNGSSTLIALFPNLWEIALEHGEFPDLLHNIQRFSKKDLRAALLEVALLHAQYVSGDTKMLNLIQELDPANVIENGNVISTSSSHESCSVRAVSLLAKSLLHDSLKAPCAMRWKWTTVPAPNNSDSHSFMLGSTLQFFSPQVCRYGYSSDYHVEERPEMSGMVHLQVSTDFYDQGYYGPGHMTVHLKWCVGGRFECNSEKLDMRLVITDQSCVCSEKDTAEELRQNQILFDVRRCIIPEKGSFEVISKVDVRSMEQYLSEHKGREPCPLTLRFDVEAWMK